MALVTRHEEDGHKLFTLLNYDPDYPIDNVLDGQQRPILCPFPYWIRGARGWVLHTQV
jgi:hypothetical protein